MILSFKQIQAIGHEVEVQRGLAYINDQPEAGDIGHHVNVEPNGLSVLVDVSGGKSFRVRTNGEVI